MNWRTKVTDHNETKVFTALDGTDITWRTIAGIARQTELPENEVVKILVKYHPTLTRLSEVPSISGSPLVGLREKVGSYCDATALILLTSARAQARP